MWQVSGRVRLDLPFHLSFGSPCLLPSQVSRRSLARSTALRLVEFVADFRGTACDQGRTREPMKMVCRD